MFPYNKIETFIENYDKMSHSIEKCISPKTFSKHVKKTVIDYYKDLLVVHNVNSVSCVLTGKTDPNITDVKNVVKEIYENKLFAMVLERFDESLLVLGKELNLELKDLAYVRIRESQRTKIKLTHSQNNTLKSICSLDAMIYNAALSMLDVKISNYGPDFNNDLCNLRKECDRLCKECKQNKMHEATWDLWPMFDTKCDIKISKLYRFFDKICANIYVCSLMVVLSFIFPYNIIKDLSCSYFV